MKAFEYAAPESEQEVLELLSSERGHTEVMAGGTDLVGLMKKPDLPAVPEMPTGANGELPTLNGQIPSMPLQRQVALRIHAWQVLNTD